ncbi:MAG: hypothetical protein O7E56_05450 [SAR324 cluster bacterium]|nr:hypothetical protein [SAR324 cluster bacterium]MCZ6627661.1 hypothetical protein [SAR324 cluster bacterium]
MARYRVQFSRDWIRGRWGFIDRMFHDLGGKETEPSRTDNAWLVEFRGSPQDLGRYLSERLELKWKDVSQFGSIFNISENPSPNGSAARRRAPARRRHLSAPHA